MELYSQYLGHVFIANCTHVDCSYLAKCSEKIGVKLPEGIREELPEEKHFLERRVGLLTMKLLNENCFSTSIPW